MTQNQIMFLVGNTGAVAFFYLTVSRSKLASCSVSQRQLLSRSTIQSIGQSFSQSVRQAVRQISVAVVSKLGLPSSRLAK
jgi:hypothetical protein